MAKYRNRFSPPPITKGERFFGKSVVEVDTYVDQNRLIRSMLASGERLAEIRAKLYDVPANSDVDSEDIELPESRRKGFDMVDLGNLRDKAKPIFEEHAERQAEAELSRRKAKKAPKTPEKPVAELTEPAQDPPVISEQAD